MFETMYINAKNTLIYRRRLTIVKQYNANKKISDIAICHKISRQSVYDILARFEAEGVYGLEDHRPGTRRKSLYPVFYANVVEIRKKTGWGACRIEDFFRKKGFRVGHNMINKVIQQENLVNPKLGKIKRPKYIRYEAQANNDQWHMDWSIDPLSKKQLLAIIDDKSRFIVFAGLFDSASAQNTAIGLLAAITKYGAPKELVTDNGSHFKNIHKRQPNEELIVIEKKYSIRHVFITPGYPQSNGKIERFFGTYKGEFPRMNHPDVYDLHSFVTFYNYERIHQSLNYDTPASRYLTVK